jgi:hypothetical protein
MNRRDQLGEYTNTAAANLAGGAVVLVTLALGGLKILRVFQLV